MQPFGWCEETPATHLDLEAPSLLPTLDFQGLTPVADQNGNRHARVRVWRQALRMGTPEYVEQFGVANPGGIVGDLDGFDMVAVVLVGGICGTSTGKPDSSRRNPLETPELGVGSPESTDREGCDRRRTPRRQQ